MTKRDLIAGACIVLVVVALLLAWNKHYFPAWILIAIDVGLLVFMMRHRPPQ